MVPSRRSLIAGIVSSLTVGPRSARSQTFVARQYHPQPAGSHRLVRVEVGRLVGRGQPRQLVAGGGQRVELPQPRPHHAWIYSHVVDANKLAAQGQYLNTLLSTGTMQ